MNLTLPGTCISCITYQYFNVLAFIQNAVLYSVKRPMNGFLIPRGVYCKNVIGGITPRTPSLLFYIFVCHCVTICGTPYLLSTYLTENLPFFCAQFFFPSRTKIFTSPFAAYLLQHPFRDGKYKSQFYQ